MSTKFILNLAASVLTALMGISHFFVPLFLSWEQHAADLFEPISWALYAMNFSYSYLLTMGGILTYISYNHVSIQKWVVGGMASFWIAGGIYQLLIPFPLVEARWVLPIISFIISILYLIVFSLTEKGSQKEEESILPEVGS